MPSDYHTIKKLSSCTIWQRLITSRPGPLSALLESVSVSPAAISDSIIASYRQAIAVPVTAVSSSIRASYRQAIPVQAAASVSINRCVRVEQSRDRVWDGVPLLR